MSTTPKKPYKWAAVIKAWVDGQAIEVRNEAVIGGWANVQPYNPDYDGESIPIFSNRNEFRIKPEPAAPVYPETKITPRELHKAVPPPSGISVEDVAGAAWPDMLNVLNFAIRRAIDDGQVVVPGSVVNAEFDPDFQEVKAGENYRWMGNTARQWQELYEKAKEAHRREVAQVSSKYSIEVHEAAASVTSLNEKLAAALSELSIYKRDFAEMLANYQRESQKYDAAGAMQKRLEHAERVLQANGFTYSPDEGWSIHSGWRGQVAQEKQDRITYLEGELTAARRACEQYKAIVHRVGRAVAMHLNRSDITENQIAAIVLLERAK